MKTTVLKTPYVLRQAHLIGQQTREGKRVMLRRLGSWMLALGLIAVVAPPPVGARGAAPDTISGSAPIEGWVSVWNPDHTEIIDSVYLSGLVHSVTQVWMLSDTQVNRVKISANVDQVDGTSEATGQRYRLVGSSVVDLQNPSVTFNEDGSFSLPAQSFTFTLLRVDPEPARLDGSPKQDTTLTAFITYYRSDPLSSDRGNCEPVLTSDGTPTTRCGHVLIAWQLFMPD